MRPHLAELDDITNPASTIYGIGEFDQYKYELSKIRTVMVKAGATFFDGSIGIVTAHKYGFYCKMQNNYYAVFPTAIKKDDNKRLRMIQLAQRYKSIMDQIQTIIYGAPVKDVES